MHDNLRIYCGCGYAKTGGGSLRRKRRAVYAKVSQTAQSSAVYGVQTVIAANQKLPAMRLLYFLQTDQIAGIFAEKPVDQRTGPSLEKKRKLFPGLRPGLAKRNKRKI